MNLKGRIARCSERLTPLRLMYMCYVSVNVASSIDVDFDLTLK